MSKPVINVTSAQFSLPTKGMLENNAGGGREEKVGKKPHSDPLWVVDYQPKSLYYLSFSCFAAWYVTVYIYIRTVSS